MICSPWAIRAPLWVTASAKTATTWPPPDIPDIATRDAMAESGEKLICGMVDRMEMPKVVEQLRKLEAYGLENEEKYPWMPSAWNRRN